MGAGAATKFSKGEKRVYAFCGGVNPVPRGGGVPRVPAGGGGGYNIKYLRGKTKNSILRRGGGGNDSLEKRGTGLQDNKLK